MKRNGRKPKVLRSDEFAEFPFEVPDFIVEPLIVPGGTHMIFGEESSGKSRLAFTLVRDLINEEPFLDKFRVGDEGPFSAAYLGVDMPKREVQKRVESMLPEVDDPSRFLVAAHDSPINIFELDESDRAWLSRIWEFDPDVLIIDTLRKIHSMDENSSQTVMRVFKALSHVFGSDQTIIIIHHEGKQLIGEDKRSPKDSARGSKAWIDSSDIGIRVKEVDDGTTSNDLTVSFPRIRFTKDIPPVSCQFDDETVLVEPGVESGKTARESALEYLAQNPNAGREELRAHLREAHDVSRQRAHQIAKEEV